MWGEIGGGVGKLGFSRGEIYVNGGGVCEWGVVLRICWGNVEQADWSGGCYRGQAEVKVCLLRIYEGLVKW